MNKEIQEKDCLGCWYFLPFKHYRSEIKEISITDEGYCLNENSEYYNDVGTKIVGKGIVCEFWSNTAPKEEDKE